MDNSLSKQAKSEISSKYMTFDIGAAISEEEFEDSLIAVGQFLLFNTGWEETLLKTSRTITNVPILRDSHLICKGRECKYAEKCPVIRKMTDAQVETLIGTDCRAERLLGVELMAGILRNLPDVRPDNFTEVLIIANMVRLEIRKRRIDWDLAIDGTMISNPGVVVQKEGRVVDKVEAHPLQKELDAIEKQLAYHRKELMATRRERLTIASHIVGKNQDILRDLFNRDWSAASETDVIDAEMSEEDTKDEENDDLG